MFGGLDIDTICHVQDTAAFEQRALGGCLIMVEKLKGWKRVEAGHCRGPCTTM